MPVSVGDVKAWVRSGGVNHAVASICDSWIWTACGSMIAGNHENIDSDKPRRICSRCRARLKVAEPVNRC